MISHITSVNTIGSRLIMDLRNPETSGFLVSSPEGLGPVSTKINTSNNPSGDGYYYTSSFMDYRTIKLPIIFWEQNVGNRTIEQLRREVYAYFPLKSKVGLIIETDTSNTTRTGMIFGYVEKIDPTFFEVATGVTISLICPDPFFRKVTYRSNHEYLLTDFDAFDTEANLSWNSSTHKFTGTINYTGDFQTGFVTELSKISESNAYDKDVRIDAGDRFLTLETYRGGSYIPSGTGTLAISTITRGKYIRYGNQDRFSYFNTSSDEWPILFIGNNTVNVYAATDLNTTFSTVKVKYHTLYGGM